MHVVLVGSGVLPIPPPDWGAVEKAIDGLARSLGSLGVEVTLVNQDGGGRTWKEYPFAWSVPRRIVELEPDIVHAFTPVVGARLAGSRRPYVYTSHSRHWNGAEGWRERLGFRLERRACAHAQRTFALSAAVAARMASFRPAPDPSRIRIVPNGIDTARFAPDWASREGKRVLGVGAIHPRKDWALAVEVMKGLPGSRLTLVGPIQDEGYARQLRSVPGLAGRLTLTGAVDEATLARHYATSDVLLHPSPSELQSISVLEALSSALPVVGTDVLSSEVESGEDGFLVPAALPEPEKVLRWREQLTALLSDASYRRSLAETARTKAVARYDWGVVGRQTLAVYRELTPA